MMRARGLRWTSWVLGAASLVAVAGFAWPLVAAAVPRDAQAAVPIVALALVPALVVAVALVLDREMYSAHTVALLGMLTAIGSAVRIAGAGVGGVEVVFIVLILAGRAYGPHFGLMLGMLTIAMSSVLSGGLGPWTPFQAFACGWVAAGAGLLPRIRLGSPRSSARLEILMLVGYGIIASYGFGLIMNLWFWPFAVGSGTGISYLPGAPLTQNLASFGLYSFVTSTLTWDTVRAATSAIGILLVGPAALAALRRATLGRPSADRARVRRRSTVPPGDGTRTRRSTAPDAVAAPPTVRRPSARA
ncbi:MAG: ECF transporter S component [Acidobacteria bacterium]|nr:ECF transporter S component [Acidobacteriota bacterium]